MSKANILKRREFWKTATLDGVVKAINQGADVNARASPFPPPPLHLAIEYCEDPNVIALLIGWGADMKALYSPGEEEALHVAACHNKNPKVLEVLINMGADLNATTKKGETPVDLAKEYNPNPEVVKLLIDRVRAHKEVSTKGSPGRRPKRRR